MDIINYTETLILMLLLYMCAGTGMPQHTHSDSLQEPIISFHREFQVSSEGLAQPVLFFFFFKFLPAKLSCLPTLNLFKSLLDLKKEAVL